MVYGSAVLCERTTSNFSFQINVDEFEKKNSYVLVSCCCANFEMPKTLEPTQHDMPRWFVVNWYPALPRRIIL